MVHHPVEHQRLYVLPVEFEICPAILAAVRCAIGDQTVIRAERLADALDIGSRVHRREMGKVNRGPSGRAGSTGTSIPAHSVSGMSGQGGPLQTLLCGRGFQGRSPWLVRSHGVLAVKPLNVHIKLTVALPGCATRGRRRPPARSGPALSGPIVCGRCTSDLILGNVMRSLTRGLESIECES